MDGGNGGAGFGGEEWLHQVVAGGKRKGKGSCYKRRFNDDQIRSLETMFEEETKLEPRKKVQLAKELGLQPRQVAIWFQNRRARWKSKQLEREYNVLKANFDGLAQRLESVELEKQSLIKQVNKLKELLEKGGDQEGKTNEDDSKVVRVAPSSEEADTKPQVAIGEGADHNTRFNSSSNEENCVKFIERFGPEESDLMSIIEPADPAPTNGRSGAWPEKWGVDLDSGSFSDQSCCTMEWWDFWV